MKKPWWMRLAEDKPALVLVVAAIYILTVLLTRLAGSYRPLAVCVSVFVVSLAFVIAYLAYQDSARLWRYDLGLYEQLKGTFQNYCSDGCCKFCGGQIAPSDDARLFYYLYDRCSGKRPEDITLRMNYHLATRLGTAGDLICAGLPIKLMEVLGPISRQRARRAMRFMKALADTVRQEPA